MKTVIKILKIALPLLAVLFSLDLGLGVGEKHIKTETELLYNWAAVPKRIGVFVAFSLIFGAIAYNIALIVEAIVIDLNDTE